MKRTVLVLSLLAVLLGGFSVANAQGASEPVALTQDQSELNVFQAYKKNLVTAVNAGDTYWAPMHQSKILNAMNREVAQGETAAASSAADAKISKGKTETLAEGTAKLKSIAETVRTMDLTTETGITAAKAKLSLLDEFEQIMVKQMPKTE